MACSDTCTQNLLVTEVLATLHCRATGLFFMMKVWLLTLVGLTNSFDSPCGARTGVAKHYRPIVTATSNVYSVFV